MSRWISCLVLVLITGTSTKVVLAETAKSPEVKIEQEVRSYAVNISATRLISNGVDQDITVAVANDNAYPFLVQSQVMEEDLTKIGPFTVVPPLFRLDPQQQSRIRIIRTGGEVRQDRESLNWLCVTGIPPEDGDLWAAEKEKPANVAKMQVQIKMSRCIKVFTRPASVKGDITSAASKLTWSRQGNELKANNSSPFYLTLKALNVGTYQVQQSDKSMIPPFGTINLPLPAKITGSVKWSVITDLGGESQIFETPLR